MIQAQKAKSVKKQIADFRLAAASVILGNDTHTACISSDMRNADHMAELCEQYSLLIVLNKLATKYGLSVCRENIYGEGDSTRSAQRALLISASLADRYPFQIADLVPIDGPAFQNLLNLAEQLVSDSPETIGDIYQQTISAPLAINNLNNPYIDLKSNQRVSGEFYTPSWVADRSFILWLNSDSANKLKLLKQDLRIIDPSCGTGNFLLAAMRMADLYLSDAREILSFARDCIFGRDIDGKAVEIAKLLIVFMVAKSYWKRDLILSSDELDELLNGLDMHLEVKDGLLNSIGMCAESEDRKFDLLITNPPYISFGSRDQQTLSKNWQMFLKRKFPASSEYKVRFTSMFQEIGIQMIKTGGQCMFLVPDAFLTGSYYQKIREHILTNVEILQLTELPESTIGDATVGRWCLAQYAKRLDRSSMKRGELASPNSNSRLSSKPPTTSLQSLFFDDQKNLQELNFIVPLSSLVSPDKKRFQLLFCEADLEIVELCKKVGFLKEELRGHTGIRARNGQASIVAPKQKNERFNRGITSGADLTSFHIEWSGNWIEIAPEKLFAGGFDPHIICNEKVLVRQTGDRLIAAADKEGLYHLNNVHSFVPQESSVERNVYFYTCLLNSSFFLYYYRLKTREHKRALAQIDIETVEHMPLPPLNATIDSILSKYGAELHELKNELFKASKDSEVCNVEIERLEAQVNELVFDLFKLSQNLRKHVQKSIS